MTNNLSDITNVSGVGSSTVERFEKSGFETIEDIKGMNPDDITEKVDGVGHSKAVNIIEYIDQSYSDRDPDSQSQNKNVDREFVPKSDYENRREKVNKQIVNIRDKIDNIEDSKSNDFNTEDIKRKINQDIKEEMKYELKEEIEEEIKEEIEEEIEEEIKEEIKEEIEEEIKEEIKEEIERGFNSIDQNHEDEKNNKYEDDEEKSIKSKIISIFIEDED